MAPDRAHPESALLAQDLEGETQSTRFSQAAGGLAHAHAGGSAA